MTSVQLGRPRRFDETILCPGRPAKLTRLEPQDAGLRGLVV